MGNIALMKEIGGVAIFVIGSIAFYIIYRRDGVDPLLTIFIAMFTTGLIALGVYLVKRYIP